MSEFSLPSNGVTSTNTLFVVVPVKLEKAPTMVRRPFIPFDGMDDSLRRYTERLRVHIELVSPFSSLVGSDTKQNAFPDSRLAVFGL